MPDVLGPIPDEIAVQIRRPPEGYVVAYIQERGRYVWRGSVSVESPGRHERIPCQAAALTLDELKPIVWHIMELARLGHVLGLNAARADRHSGRTVAGPDVAAINAARAAAASLAPEADPA